MDHSPASRSSARAGDHGAYPSKPAHEPLSQESLLELFQPLVDKNYSAVGLKDEALADYVARLLVSFARPEMLYAVRHGQGRKLEETLESMLAASDPLHNEAGSFEREAAVRRHIGDFTLFFTGMFPDSLHQHRGADRLLEFVAAGKASYEIVCAFERTRGECERASDWAALALPVAAAMAPGAPVYAALASQFERCMHGLNLVSSEIASFGGPAYRAARELLM